MRTNLPQPSVYKAVWPWEETAPIQSRNTYLESELPRISIVTPSYNQGGFLEETIRSVLLQDYPKLEYIIIDGGSRDGSIEIINKYKPWLACWVSEPDRGQSHAINKGLQRCTGDIITFLSSDDIYLPESLLDVGNRWLEWQACGALVGAFFFQDERSQIQGDKIVPFINRDSPTDLTIGPPGVYRLHQVSTFYNRQALDNVGCSVRQDMQYVMDRELLYRVARKYPIRFVDRPYGVFRRHADNKSAARDILPFATEFAQLYLDSQDGSPHKDRQRRRMARYRLARGFFKYARTTKGIEASSALVKAAYYWPRNLANPKYYRFWKQAIAG